LFLFLRVVLLDLLTGVRLITRGVVLRLTGVFTLVLLVGLITLFGVLRLVGVVLIVLVGVVLIVLVGVVLLGVVLVEVG
jgi:hypothetical protein